jgi:Uma2 family endonuclease
MAITVTKLLTADDLLRLSGQGVRGELIRGMLHETTSSGLEHSKIVVNLSSLLGVFVKPRT